MASVKDRTTSLSKDDTEIEPPSDSLASSPSSSSTLFPARSNNKNQNNNEQSVISKVLRRMHVFWLAGRVFFSYKLVQRQDKRLRRQLQLEDDDDKHPAIQQLWENAHERNAQRILKGIQQLQGFWIKVGQYMSSRADIMPPQYLRILSTLQDGVPAKPFDDILQTLGNELPVDVFERLTYIDPKPLSTASLAQVHRATLQYHNNSDNNNNNSHTHVDCVLKVQHTGVASLMLQDMDNLRTILRLLAMNEPDMDYNPIADEYSKEVRKELNFCTEADNTREIAEVLRDHRVVLPTVHYVTPKVMVMEYCPGFSIRDTDALDQHGVDRRLLLERICQAWATQMHEAGVFNGDPHPGNILVSTAPSRIDNSVPVLLDFGLTKRLSHDKKMAFAKMVYASYESDIDALLQSFDEMGLKLNRYDPFQDMQNMQTAFADPTPQSEAAQAKKERTKRQKEEQDAMREDQGVTKGQKLRNPVDAWPSELIFFFRVSAMLRGLCSRLEARYPYLSSMAQAAATTLRQSVPHHAQTLVYDADDLPKTALQQRLSEIAVELLRNEEVVGMQVCAMHKGEIVANVAAGCLGKVNPRPVTPSSLFNVFSVSKGVLATGALRLLQDKEISVDEPIAKYWPQFGKTDERKRRLTIRQALSHQAGLANSIPAKATVEILTNWKYMTEFIAGPEAVPEHEPGTETHYHYLSFAWIIGGFIEAVTGEPYEVFLEKNVLDELGIANELHLGGLPEEIAREELAVLTAQKLQEGTRERDQQIKHEASKTVEEEQKQRERLAKFRGQEHLMNPSIFNMWDVRKAKIPSANGHASAEALAKLFDGIVRGTVLCKSMLLDAMSPQDGTSIRGSRVMLDNARASLSLGYQLHEVHHKDGKSSKTLRTIGHAGFGGSIVLAIPELELSVAFTTNQLGAKSVAKSRLLTAILDYYDLEASQSLSE